jgi:hypothetical protein
LIRVHSVASIAPSLLAERESEGEVIPRENDSSPIVQNQSRLDPWILALLAADCVGQDGAKDDDDCPTHDTTARLPTFSLSKSLPQARTGGKIEKGLPRDSRNDSCSNLRN